MLAPESVSVPAPVFVNPPAPLNTPLSAVLLAPLIVSSLPLFATGPEKTSAPLAAFQLWAAPRVTAVAIVSVAVLLLVTPLEFTV